MNCTSVKKDAKLAQNLGQLQAFYRCTPTGMRGPTCILWANLTSLSLSRFEPVPAAEAARVRDTVRAALGV